MAGRKQFTQEVEGISEIQQELAKMNADSRRNFKIGITTAIIAGLTLLVSIVALLR